MRLVTRGWSHSPKGRSYRPLASWTGTIASLCLPDPVFPGHAPGICRVHWGPGVVHPVYVAISSR